MAEFRRRPEKEPEVYRFEEAGNHRSQMIEGHHLAAWAMARGEASAQGRAKFVEVRPADNGMYARGVHVVGKNEARGSTVFLIHAGEYLVWENDEFRVYSEADFGKVFEAVPQAAPKNPDRELLTDSEIDAAWKKASAE